MKKPLILLLATATAMAIAFVSLFDLGALLHSKRQQNDQLLEQQLAEHIGTLAYLYGYPLVDAYQQRHNETHRLDSEQQVYAPINRLYRYPHLVTPATAGNLRAANNDTLYYTGWYDISEEPLIIHTPDTAGRYFTIAVTNSYSEVVHIGRRTHGTAENYYALVTPQWRGALPDGVTAITSETPTGWLLGRMLVNGPDDFPAAKALVDNVWLAGLSEFSIGQRPAATAEKRATALDVRRSLDFFEVFNAVLKTLPPRATETALMAQFDSIGIGPQQDFDSDALSEAHQRGLLSAIENGYALVAAGNQKTIPDYNGWMISQKIGRYGYDYAHRASVVKGGYGNLPEESLYPATFSDSDDQLLHGKHRYRIHFPAGQLPPVDGFWSLSVYNLDQNVTLAENAIQRYSIGDRSETLRFNDDGSLTLWLQQRAPKNTDNWLPTPDGPFLAVMRLYEPSAAALSNHYHLPRIERLDP